MYKISISNIAWDISENKEIYSFLKSNSINGLEIAPSKLFSNILDVNDTEIYNFLEEINKYNLQLTAMQSVLFNQPELQIFNDNKSREETLIFLKKIILLAQKLNIKNIVFGSPKNRFVHIVKKKTYSVAVDFFRRIGDYANNHNVSFCIEPNSIKYGCNFITNTQDALDLINDVGSEGFRCHIDAAVMKMNDEDIEENLMLALPFMKHFHISEPYLDYIPNNRTNHDFFLKTLKKINYDNWVSIEMKNNIRVSNIESVKESISYIKNIVDGL